MNNTELIQKLQSSLISNKVQGEIIAHVESLQAEVELLKGIWPTKAAAIQVAVERDELRAQVEAVQRDAERYRIVRRGQHWSVINGIGDELRGEELDAAIAAIKGAAPQPQSAQPQQAAMKGAAA
jgi:hypothetical protein